MSPRLRPGAVLYETADGSWRCYQPGERFLRVSATPELLRLLQPVLHGATSLAEATATAGDPEGLEQLVEAFGAQGLLDTGAEPATGPLPAGPEPRADAAGARVHVEGDTPIAEAAARELAPHAHVTRGPVTEQALAGLDVLLTCGGWLTDARWQRLDRWCERAGVAWHMTYAEGLDLVAGPCALPGRAPRYADTRARRLAAAAFPDELAHYWRALDSAVPLPPVRWPGAGAQAAVVDLLVADTRAWLAAEPVPGAGVQAVVDSRDGGVHRHAVRPLPDLEAATS